MTLVLLVVGMTVLLGLVFLVFLVGCGLGWLGFLGLLWIGLGCCECLRVWVLVPVILFVLLCLVLTVLVVCWFAVVWFVDLVFGLIWVLLFAVCVCFGC